MDASPKTRTREGHMGMINSIRCHSLPQIAALLHRERWVVASSAART